MQLKNWRSNDFLGEYVGDSSPMAYDEGKQFLNILVSLEHKKKVALKWKLHFFWLHWHYTEWDCNFL